jgi:hypothetical protein
MKFSIVRLEDRIAPTHGPVQQAIVAGGGSGSKGGPSLIMAQQGFDHGSPFQQAIVVGGGKGSKAGPALIMAQQWL